MALIAGMMAAAGAETVVAALLKWGGFELPVQGHPWLWVVLPVLSLALVVVIIRSMIKRLLMPLKG